MGRRASFLTQWWALVPCALVVCGCVPPPVLLADLEKTELGSDPGPLAQTPTGFYLVATSPQVGRELFYTPDGTVSGLQPQNIIDVRPGADSSSPGWVFTVGSRAFFGADDGTEHPAASDARNSLFVTDGTKDTTVRLLAPTEYQSVTPFAPLGTSGMLFQLTDVSDTELWRTDGTPGGTKMIANINPSGPSYPFGMTQVGSGVFVFAATDGSGDRELWKTDGTTASRVADLYTTGSSSPSGFVAWKGKGYFSATISPGTVGLFVTDGTAGGTTRFTTLTFPKAGFGIGNGTQLFFSGGSDLFVTDGTAGGTQDIATLTLDSNLDLPANYRAVGSRVMFYVETDDTDMDLVEDVWSTDGTPAGTSVLMAGTVTDDHGILFGGKLYFTEQAGALMRSDGTLAGTETLYTAPGNATPGLLGFVGGKMMLDAADPTMGWELFSMDPAPGTPTLFANINEANGSSYPGNFGGYGSQVFFSATVSGTGTEPYVTDGTPAGTKLFMDLGPGWFSSNPGNFTSWNGALYFDADDGVHGQELWRSDGTPAGTHMVADIALGESGSISLPYIGPTTMFLYADEPDNYGIELWKTDGTTAGTVLVKDINPGTDSSTPFGFATYNGKVYFSAQTATQGRELWVSDGTKAGTHIVKDILAGTASSDVYYSDHVAFNGFLYFAATDGVTGSELYRTNGTAAGTVRVTDINPGAADSVRVYPRVVGTRLLFQANDGTRNELWATDGTTTTMVTGAINPAGSNAEIGVVVGTSMFFTATDVAHGTELFITDGTAAGTHLVSDINPAPGVSSGINYLTALGGKVYFSANDGSNGTELWTSDGTASGTMMLTGNTGDPSSSSPFSLTAVGTKLYMQLTDPITGSEPYVFTP